MFEDTRYNRHENMPEWGKEGQRRISRLSVLAVGAGGVKSPLLMALVTSGVGRLHIMEFDSVENSNLNRQWLYKESDVGRPKGEVALRILRAMNSTIDIQWFGERANYDTLRNRVKNYDLIIEGGDSLANRYEVNDVCIENCVPFVHASAQYAFGYVCSVIPSKGTACLRCILQVDGGIRTTGGPVPVAGIATGIAGTLGAAEVIKYGLGRLDNMEVNRRLCFSSLLGEVEFMRIHATSRPGCACQKTNQAGRDKTI
jgi:adenylyltransferase/sulfurtransferase